jgi:Uma2 family endonuclease
MSQSYEEIFGGTTFQRKAPGPRHELICGRLHDNLRAAVAKLASTRLLPPRSAIPLSASHKLCPDLALITVATNKAWLVAEIVSSDDHHIDTVEKKQVYEDLRLPRLWMIDPRYDNIEVYHATEYGMSLRGILAGRDVLGEKLLPDLQLVVADLFRSERSV